MLDLRSSIFQFDSNRVFYEIRNREGKEWLIPEQNSHVGLQIYQPSNWKGKWLKRGFGLIKKLPFLWPYLGIQKTGGVLNAKINAMLQPIFKANNIEYAIFMGTPSVHQKITLQLFSGTDVLGYCKLGNTNVVKNLFEHECDILQALKNQQIEGIPLCLKLTTLDEQIHLFVQSTRKSLKSRTLFNFSDVHHRFLKELHQKTVVRLVYEQSDFYKSLKALEQLLRPLGTEKLAIVLRAINMVHATYTSKEVVFSMNHGDFTPWNMFIDSNQLFVFDWEYAQQSCPAYLDVFHFHTQLAIHHEKQDALSIFNGFKARYEFYKPYFENPSFSFRCYLLNVMGIYLLREEDSLDADRVKKIASVWIELLTYLEENGA